MDSINKLGKWITIVIPKGSKDIYMLILLNDYLNQTECNKYVFLTDYEIFSIDLIKKYNIKKEQWRIYYNTKNYIDILHCSFLIL